ncbi:MAG TPA: hypothetical protein VF655_11955 [Allosphingosinicella sp.]|jgi:hypothetical protein
MKSLLAAALLLATVSTPAFAQQDAEAPAAEEDVKVNQLIVYGDDPCPPSTDEVITVCARLNDEERFRIPNNLRDRPGTPGNEAWGARAVALQYVGRSGIGSCSPTGVGGASGCYNELIRQARAERAADPRINWENLIDEARQKRLSKIDEKAKEEEEAENGPR